MSAYLPKDSANNFPYSDGGGLYALGLIHANHGGEIIDYLFNQLKSSTTEVNIYCYYYLLKINFNYF